VCSFAGFGREARSYASAWADVARWGNPATELRRSSLDTVEADLSITTPIRRSECPWARSTAISSRWAKVRHLPFRSRPRRGLTPPASASPAPGPPARIDRHNGVSDEITGLHPGPKQLQKIRSYVN
jgi:hypothetical protein